MIWWLRDSHSSKASSPLPRLWAPSSTSVSSQEYTIHRQVEFFSIVICIHESPIVGAQDACFQPVRRICEYFFRIWIRKPANRMGSGCSSGGYIVEATENFLQHKSLLLALLHLTNKSFTVKQKMQQKTFFLKFDQIYKNKIISIPGSGAASGYRLICGFPDPNPKEIIQIESGSGRLRN